MRVIVWGEIAILATIRCTEHRRACKCITDWVVFVYAICMKAKPNSIMLMWFFCSFPFLFECGAPDKTFWQTPNMARSVQMVQSSNCSREDTVQRKIEHKFELPCKESIFNCVTHVNSAKLVSPQAAGSRHIDGDDDVTVEWRHVE